MPSGMLKYTHSSPVSIQMQSLALRTLRLDGNRAKRKRLHWQAANHGCHCIDRASYWLQAAANRMLGRSSGNQLPISLATFLPKKNYQNWFTKKSYCKNKNGIVFWNTVYNYTVFIFFKLHFFLVCVMTFIISMVMTSLGLHWIITRYSSTV